MHSITSITVQSIHLAAGHVRKSFTAFSGAQVSSVSNYAVVSGTQRRLNFSGVGSLSITLELLYTVLLGRASPVAMCVTFMSLIPSVLTMILKPINTGNGITGLLIFPHLRSYYRDYCGCRFCVILYYIPM